MLENVGSGSEVALRPPPRGWDWGDAWSCCVREARRVLRCPVAAEDAAQEALLRAWTNRSNCRNAGEPGGWLAAIAHREALRLRSRNASRPELPVDDAELESVDAPEDEPMEPVLASLRAERLLSSLSRADRELVRLRYFEDLTQAETADRLGIPEGTAKVRLHRARQRLVQSVESGY